MKELRGVLDRFEGDIAFIEIDGQIKEYPKRLLSDGIKEGDVVIVREASITIDQKQTKARIEKMNKLIEDAWE